MKQLKFQITVHMDVDMTLSFLLIFTFSAGYDADGAWKARGTKVGLDMIIGLHHLPPPPTTTTYHPKEL